ncbi:hypothetical protein MNBD_BACTEROID06-1043 [hydrothermal vent metagenome]|uniref:Transposase IS4-like domain-containing protein n=1 Tax=hydrothermal vent metagenome TaxID=652676 RepID=A0A3B0U550_9ZZZZ
MKPANFFLEPQSIYQKQYEALRCYYIEKKSAKEVAKLFGYKHRGFTTIVSEFNAKLKETSGENLFFKPVIKGRKPTREIENARSLVIALRKQYHSVEEIKVILNSKNITISEKSIYGIIKSEGFSRLPRREKLAKQQLQRATIKAEKSVVCKYEKVEEFKSSSAGTLCFLPLIKELGIDKIIENSAYPETKFLSRLNSILSFIALKANSISRYSQDDLWCMDKGMGMFSGLNVLPKAAWFSSYSHRVTSNSNLTFLKELHQIWQKNNLLGDTSNLDFTTIPYWGDDAHLENNWSGKRNKALSSMLAVLAHDPDSGIIDYGNANIRHENESDTVIEFLDFYRSSPNNQNSLKYLVFDSKFTNYQNLDKLNKQGVCFLTIRRRGKKIVEHINQVDKKQWKTIRVPSSANKKRALKVYDHKTKLNGYEGEVREIYITGNGKIKPAIIILNDFSLKTEEVVHKYAKRWLVEKAISEQISFFHLNSVSSSMVVKVDFDLTISILTHNLYRIFAMKTERYTGYTAKSIFEKILLNSADIKITDEEIIVYLKKKRSLPILLEIMEQYKNIKIPWLNNKKLSFRGASYS